jgi:hypothetical protein
VSDTRLIVTLTLVTVVHVALEVGDNINVNVAEDSETGKKHEAFIETHDR